jgi:hypothetical protein
MNGMVAVLVIAAVAAIAWLLRRGSVEPVPGDAAARTGDAPTDSSDTEEDDEGPIEELAITSDGVIFIPDGYAVRVIPLDPHEVETHHEDIEAGVFALSPRERLQLAAQRGKPGQALSVGDFTAARIRRGAADVVPWLLETLGRDGEYLPFMFETEDGARAALALLEGRKIVRRPLDEDGRPIPPSPEDFEEARRRYDESWQALAMEREPGDEPGPPYSDRR